jgi:uncharacterized protein YjbI with pentapeptide repeats
MRWWVIALLAVAGCAVGLLIGLGLGSTSAGPPVAGLSPAQLQQAKLQQEVRQLQISNQQDASLQHTLLDWAPFITGLGAIAAVGATLWKQATDLESARTETRVTNEQWRERFLEDQRNSRIREQENSLRRFDANLSIVISNLGSSSETRQVNAAAALGTYLRPRYADFHIDLLAVVAANLRLQPSAPVARALRADLERLLRLVFGNPESYGDDFPRDLDFSRASLRRFDVSGVDFRGTVVDVAFADLLEARLASANLFRLRGREVHLERAYCSRAVLREARLDGAYCHGIVLHNANLVSASLKNADLSGAQFQEALMQEAHLEGANLAGANFTKANLANTYFRDTRLDEAAMRSIASGALRWRDNQNFDIATKQALERYAPGQIAT